MYTVAQVRGLEGPEPAEVPRNEPNDFVDEFEPKAIDHGLPGWEGRFEGQGSGFEDPEGHREACFAGVAAAPSPTAAARPLANSAFISG